MKKLLVLLAGLLMLAVAIPALAHETRTTDDGINIVFGWGTEPAFAGLPNGPEIMLTFSEADDDHGHDEDEDDDHHGGGAPVTDADLQVTVTFGDQSMTVGLRPAWGQPGRYVANIMPMLPGDYTFRVFGTAGGFEIDETFTSADGMFDTVDPVADIQFPVTAPTTLELMQMIADLQAQIDALRAQLEE